MWIRCNLPKKGTEYPEARNKKALDGDPAKRLGIRVRYWSKGNGKMGEDWYNVETDSDMKKVNLLVDFLDEENEGYTANQPRRFLAQKKGKNRRPATYT